MADPVTAGVFPTTLLLLYFTTPAANLPANETKDMQEKKALWTFQSSSEISLPDPDTCTSTALQMMAEIKPVRTMTVRAYCLCPNSKVGNKERFNDKDEKGHFVKPEARANARPFVKAIGPKTPDSL
jgi:hypothetical protein